MSSYTNGQTTVDSTSKKISKNVNSMKDQSSDLMGEAKEKGEHLVSDVSAYLQSEGTALVERFEERFARMSTDLKDLRAKAEKTVQQHPYYTLMGVAAVGVVAGLLLRGRRR